MAEITLPQNLVTITTSLTIGNLTYTTTISAQTYKLPEIESVVRLSWGATLSALHRAQQATNQQEAAGQ